MQVIFGTMLHGHKSLCHSFSSRYSVSRPVETHMSGASKNSAQHTKVKRLHCQHCRHKWFYWYTKHSWTSCTQVRFWRLVLMCFNSCDPSQNHTLLPGASSSVAGSCKKKKQVQHKYTEVNKPLYVNRSTLLPTLWPKRNWICWPN